MNFFFFWYGIEFEGQNYAVCVCVCVSCRVCAALAFLFYNGRANEKEVKKNAFEFFNNFIYFFFFRIHS